MLPPLVGGALFVIGLLLPLSGEARAAIALAGVGIAVARAPRLRERTAELWLAPGRLQIHAGAASQTIRARDVVGISTARTAGGGVGVAIARRDGPRRPLLLDLANDNDVDRLRGSLGVGHFGFGTLQWPTEAVDVERNAGIAAAVGWIALACLLAVTSDPFVFGLFLYVGPIAAACTLVALGTRLFASPPCVTLTAYGATVVDARGRLRHAAYSDFSRDPRYFLARNTLLPEEKAHIAAQIETAARRARGEGPPPPALPPLQAVLSTRGEPAREWLQRVDATAASLGAPDAYRRADVHETDLWDTLENPDAPPSLRAASARVLARLRRDEAGPRIARVLEIERDDRTRARIRIALEDDVEQATLELERLDGR